MRCPGRMCWVAAVTLSGAGALAQPLPALRADAGQVSVSGLSSGGFMAVQFHVAYSASVMGAGVVAGGPFYCAQNSVDIALNNCMLPDPVRPVPRVEALVAFTEAAARAGAVDATANLQRSRVWLFSGRKDPTVLQPVVTALQHYYLNFMPPSQVRYVNTVDAGHAFPTLNFGSECTFTGTPFIDRCGVDGAGMLLEQIHGPLAAAGAPVDAHLQEFDQREFFDHADAYSHSMRHTGVVYVPASCRAGGCRVHVAFHGCLQNVGSVGDSFVRHAGYNKWAETNRLIVLYPQTIARYGPGFRFWRVSYIVNPKGCWDWWGYDSPNYYRKDGPQMRAVLKMIERLASG
jgi:poly(3-hydroxybutyrate) depolymerase